MDAEGGVREDLDDIQDEEEAENDRRQHETLLCDIQDRTKHEQTNENRQKEGNRPLLYLDWAKSKEKRD